MAFFIIKFPAHRPLPNLCRSPRIWTRRTYRLLTKILFGKCPRIQPLDLMIVSLCQTYKQPVPFLLRTILPHQEVSFLALSYPDNNFVKRCFISQVLVGPRPIAKQMTFHRELGASGRHRRLFIFSTQSFRLRTTRAEDVRQTKKFTAFQILRKLFHILRKDFYQNKRRVSFKKTLGVTIPIVIKRLPVNI